ncbi:MAG: O-antigen ligase family protein [Candidatus Acidoferrales bacterium]
MPPSASYAPSARLSGSPLALAWRNRWGLYMILAGALSGLTSALILYAFGAGPLVAVGLSALVAMWLFFYPNSFLLLFLFFFVAAACPYLKFGGLTDALRYVVLAATAYYLVIRLFLQRLPLQFRWKHLPLLLFCFWALATATYSRLPLLTLLKAGAFAVLMAFCFLYAKRFPNNPRASTESFFQSLLFLDVLLVSASLVLRWTGKEITRYAAHGVEPAAMYGAFFNPNSLGIFTALALPVVFWYMHRRPRWRYPLWLLAAANLYCLVASRSRASYAAALAGLGLYLYFRNRKLLLVAVVLLAMVGGLYVAYAPQELDKLSTLYVYKGRETVLECRLDHWKRSLAYIRQSWFFGYGLGASPGGSQEWHFSFSSWRALRVRGSSLLAIWEETGLPGFLLLGLYPFWVASQGLRYLLRSRRPMDSASIRILVLTVVLFAGMGNMLFEEWILAPGFFVTVFFWILIFLLLDELWTVARPAPGIPTPTITTSPE